jgi:hypothetical protein
LIPLPFGVTSKSGVFSTKGGHMVKIVLKLAKDAPIVNLELYGKVFSETSDIGTFDFHFTQSVNIIYKEPIKEGNNVFEISRYLALQDALYDEK